MVLQFAYHAGDLLDFSIFVELELILANKGSCLHFAFLTSRRKFVDNSKKIVVSQRPTRI